jgi:hypothetical protein
VVPLLNRIGSGSQTWVAVAVTRPALSALALLVFALFAGDDLPGLLAELAPPLDNGLGLMLMPAVAASAALPAALRWHVQHADTAHAARGSRDHPRALPRPGRPLVRSRRRRASHGGGRRSGRRGSRAHPDRTDPASELHACCVPRRRKDAIGWATSGPRLRPADRGKQPQPGLGQTDGQGNDARPGRPEQRRPRPPGEVGGRGAAPRTTSPDHQPAPEGMRRPAWTHPAPLSTREPGGEH